MQAVVDKTIASFGRVDILVNNAGVTWAAEPEDMPLDKWQKVVDINLTGAFLFAQAAGRDMLKRQYGRIINIASIAGHARVGAGAALRGLRGDQGGPDRADARAGGVVGAQGHPRQRDCARLLPLAARRRRDRDERSRRSRRRSPIPRVGDAGELKGVAVFLAADASNYITGQTIVVDGGRTIA